jgi:hypothetical protein
MTKILLALFYRSVLVLLTQTKLSAKKTIIEPHYSVWVFQNMPVSFGATILISTV